MSWPKCPHCESTSFQSELREVSGYRYKVNVFHCWKCGNVVGILPFYDPGVLAQDNKKEIGELKRQISHLQAMVAALVQQLQYR